MLRISIRTDGIEPVRQKLTDGTSKAAHAVAVQAMKDTEPFVPARTKSLINRTRARGDEIIYPGPYARYLYYGKLMVDPDTGSPFARKGKHKVLTDKDLVFSQAVSRQAQAHWFEASKAQNMDKWLRVVAKAVSTYGNT